MGGEVRRWRSVMRIVVAVVSEPARLWIVLVIGVVLNGIRGDRWSTLQGETRRQLVASCSRAG